MNKILFVCLYVDDIIYMSSSQDLILEFKSNMKSMFQMYALGILSYFFGLEVKREGSGIFVTQRKHVEDYFFSSIWKTTKLIQLQWLPMTSYCLMKVQKKKRCKEIQEFFL